MRHSAEAHNVARLRVFIGEKQEAFAKMIGCSIHTLQSVETGRTDRLKLSEHLARKISSETGIACDWLLENDLEAPLVADSLRPFTIEHYSKRRSYRELGLPTFKALAANVLGETYAIVFFAWLRAIFATKDADIALWKAGKFLEKLAADYGHARDILPSRRLEIAALRDHKKRWEQAKVGVRLARKYVHEYEGGLRELTSGKRPARRKRRR
jgi:transcriptional regulator with XRE-family HTH domain